MARIALTMCRIAELASTPQPVDFEQYHQNLHPDGRALIRDWHKRAAGRAGGFESFIYLWIAFNGWAACVTGKDADREWVKALIADPELNECFARLVDDPSRQTADAAKRFRGLWPIFRVAELRRLGINYWHTNERDRARTAHVYRKAGAGKFALCCYYRFHNENPPLDWGHTLAVLYRVRCNLFHGEKARTSGHDRTVVTAAHATLLSFVDEATLFGD